jgi:hypothetical protein
MSTITLDCVRRTMESDPILSSYLLVFLAFLITTGNVVNTAVDNG